MAAHRLITEETVANVDAAPVSRAVHCLVAAIRQNMGGSQWYSNPHLLAGAGTRGWSGRNLRENAKVRVTIRSAWQSEKMPRQVQMLTGWHALLCRRALARPPRRCRCPRPQGERSGGSGRPPRDVVLHPAAAQKRQLVCDHCLRPARPRRACRDSVLDGGM